MTLEVDLVTWIATRPGWQQEVFLRLCRDEPIKAADIEALADRLVAGNLATSHRPTVTDIPGHSPATGGVHLTSLHGVTGVNALAASQRLTFGPVGLTIIYGDNASGKSGYARVLKFVVGGRVLSSVLGDVYAKTPPPPVGATVEYDAGGQSDSWAWADQPNPALRQIHYYDEADGDAYLGSDSEITYRPAALMLLDQLIAVCDAVRAVLDERLRRTEAAKSPLPIVPGDTPAARFLAGLTAATTSAAVRAACAAPANAKEQLGTLLSEEARLKSSDPSKERDRLQALAGELDKVAAHIERMSARLTPEAIRDAKSAKETATALRAAAAIASARDFSSEPVQGVGSRSWRALWEAARVYSETEAYHEHTFPVTGDEARCVLCHQTLTSEAGDRLQRFQTFMTDTTERDAAKAEADLTSTRRTLTELTVVPAAVATAQAKTTAAGEALAETAGIWVTTAADRLKVVLSYLDGTADAMPEPSGAGPAAELKARATELRQTAATIDGGTFAERLRICSQDAASLQGQIALAAAVGAITAEVDRLQARSKLEATKRATETSAITRKASDLTRDHVTKEVRDQFTRESERLHLRRITLSDTSGKKGHLLHRPALLGASRQATVAQVLSEGEQTALGLSGLFTEAFFDVAKSALILDDPVTSLDHRRRSLVASRLVQLAADRQVIVFTHEVTFVGDLVRHAKEAGVPVTERCIHRCGDVPGSCADKHPWKAKDVATRIDHLGTELARIKRERSDWEDEQYEKETSEWAGELSETWERAINLEIINEVVDRGTSQVRPLKFRILAKITAADDAEFQAGYGRASEWARRHDKAPEINYVAPEPDEMEDQLTHLKQWFDRIKRYRNQ